MRQAGERAAAASSVEDQARREREAAADAATAASLSAARRDSAEAVELRKRLVERDAELSVAHERTEIERARLAEAYAVRLYKLNPVSPRLD